MMARSLKSDQRGVAIIELAIVLPILMLFLFGTVQIGKLLFARADIQNAVSRGARVASVYPRPQDDVISKAVEEQIAGLDQGKIIGPVVESKVNSDGLELVEITVTYDQPIDFIIFESAPIRLRETQRVFTQPRES